MCFDLVAELNVQRVLRHLGVIGLPQERHYLTLAP